MKKITKKINKKGPAPYAPTLRRSRSGFVLLFAVTISAILLAIALGVSNIALKEVKFSTSAKETNNAFFASDTGIEYVLFHDKAGGDGSICAPNPGETCNTNFIVYGLGDAGQSCAIVKITKDNTIPPVVTTIISKGYNLGGDNPSCASSNPDRIEREIKVSY